MDVSTDESVQEAVKEVMSREGRIDIVVSNAGAMCFGELLYTLQICLWLTTFPQVLCWTFPRPQLSRRSIPTSSGQSDSLMPAFQT